MTRPNSVFPALCLLVFCAAGCGVPAAVARSQRLQMQGMVQYRDEMAAYHEKVTRHLAAEKRSQLDAALAASLAQSADPDGRIDVTAAAEKAAKRIALEDEFRANLTRLDGEFAQRQAAIGRAIELARDTLDLMASYGRLASLVRSLFVREAEARECVSAYDSERNPTHAGSPGEPAAFGR